MLAMKRNHRGHKDLKRRDYPGGVIAKLENWHHGLVDFFRFRGRLTYDAADVVVRTAN
jgi:hypothetical protein